MHNVKMTESLLCKPQFAWETGYMLIVCQECPEHPRSMLLCTMVPDISVLQACPCPQKATNLIAQIKHVSVLYPHRCSLSYPGMHNCPCAVSQQAAWEGWAVAVSLPAPHRRERRDARGALHCTAWAAYLFPGWESHPGLLNPSAVPPLQHCNTWKGLNLVLNVMQLCKSQGCNAVQKQTENMVWLQPSESG